MDIRLFDSELKIMELLWEKGPTAAKDIAAAMAARTGWEKTTTYTVLKKCVEKGAVKRTDPGFLCTPLITQEAVRQSETNNLVARLYGGSADLLVATLLNGKALSKEEIAALRQMVEELG